MDFQYVILDGQLYLTQVEKIILQLVWGWPLLCNFGFVTLAILVCGKLLQGIYCGKETQNHFCGQMW